MNKHIKITGITIFFLLALSSLTFCEEEEFVITTYYPSPYGSYNELTTYSNTYLATTSGNVGIGTSSPSYKLDITGALRATSNTYLATSSGNVGIGTLNPAAKLEVIGQIKITGGSPGANKVLTSDASGVANWTPITSLISYSCPEGKAIREIKTDGSVTCESVGGGGGGGGGGTTCIAGGGATCEAACRRQGLTCVSSFIGNGCTGCTGILHSGCASGGCGAQGVYCQCRT